MRLLARVAEGERLYFAAATGLLADSAGSFVVGRSWRPGFLTSRALAAWGMPVGVHRRRTEVTAAGVDA